MIENREYTATAAVENRSEDFTSGHKTKMTIAFTTLLVAIVAVFVDRFVIMRIQRQFSYTEGNSEAGVRFDVVDEEVLSLFVTFDENLDGVLDLSEFIQIANRILRRKVSNRVVIFLIFFFLKLVEIHGYTQNDLNLVWEHERGLKRKSCLAEGLTGSAV